jgi:hypothetical protein
MVARIAIALSPWTLPLGLFVGLLALVGFWGISIEDGGLIPGLSQRILLGEVPHADFISPLPVGSSVLHLIDYALPLPLVLASKVVTIAEFVAYGMFFSLFVYQKRLAQLSFVESAGAVVAVLVGLHQFPVISFYTIDGLVLCGGAFVLIQRGTSPSLRLGHVAAAFALLGVAATTKQSFWFAPFYVFAWVVLTRLVRRAPLRQIVEVTVVSVGSCALAPAAYVLWVVSGGGFEEMWAELTHTSRVYGTELVTQLHDPGLYASLLPVVALFAILRFAPPRLPWADVAIRVVLSAVILYVTLQNGLAFNKSWSRELFWCVAAVFAVRSLAARRLDVVGLTVLFTGWMVTLSYGAPTPALAAGASVLYVADAVWRDVPVLTAARSRVALVVGAVAAAAFVTAVSIHVRTRSDYGVPRGSEVWTLKGDAGGVNTDENTARYLSDAEKCLRQHPAKWKAVLPEGALADAVFRLRNPFPLDWFWPPDYAHAGGRQRLIDAASQTDARGNYLLLFQTNALPGPNIPGKIQSFIFDRELGQEITSRLTHARRYQCGEFIAFYDPRT